MLKNYFKTAIRSLFKNRLFSGINILGLALSMCVCLIVIMVTSDAFTYDNFHPFPKRTFRMISDLKANNGSRERWATVPMMLADQLQKDFPFVEKTVQVYPAISDEVIVDKGKIPIKGSFTQPSFFSLFGFKLLQGNKITALEKPYSAVMAKQKSDILFPHHDALGKVVRLKNIDANFTITGIIQDGYKTFFDNDVYVSFSTLPDLVKQKKINADLESWRDYNAVSTYVLLKKNTTISSLKNALNGIAVKNNKLFSIKNVRQLKYDFQRLDKITPGEQLLNGGFTPSASGLWAITGIAFLILLLACFNYTNLSIARSLTRVREVGVRKIMGGSRAQLFIQFIVESIVVAFSALLLACLFLGIIYNYPISKTLLEGINPSYYLFLWLIPFAIFSGLLAGSLPAWILSAYKPIDVMKGMRAIKLFKSFRPHKILIATQFSVSLLFVIFLVTIYKQTSYLKSFSYGFDQTNILNINIKDKDINLLKSQILSIPGVERISATSDVFGFNSTDFVQIKKNIDKESIGIDSYFVDEGFLQNMNLDLIAGTNFTAANLSKETYVILNEKAAKALNFNNAANAIGKLVWLDDSTQVIISGVVKDFYYLNPKHELGNLVLRNNLQKYNYLNIKTAQNSRTQVIKGIQSIWKKSYNNEPLVYQWFDDELKQGRDKPDDLLTIIFLTLMAITISCMGLLGIVTYSSEIREKEISIRKVLGAEVRNLLFLLSKDFVLLLVSTCLVTLPIGYFISNIFLHEFANRVTVGWEILAESTFIIMIIGLLAIFSQTVKAALANPVKSLRSE